MYTLDILASLGLAVCAALAYSLGWSSGRFYERRKKK